MTASTPTAPAAAPATKTFSDFGVDERICSALADAGIVTPFPIQELTLPLALAGADLIGQARTGTGKTLAFGIPMLQRIDRDRGGVQALVIVPTRELCLQVAEDLARAGANLDLSVLPCYGGKAIDVQIEALRAGADVVVGTPGRLLDLRNRRELDLSTVTGLVLDEADEMLDLGFLPDVESLITSTAEPRQTLLFSATMPGAVVSLARRYMSKPTFLRAEVEEVRIAPETQQHFFSCHRMDKPAILARILQAPGRGLCVVFTRTKRMADILAEELRARDVDAAAIHSDLRQDARERALRRFRDGQTTVLVATEVAARGLDIDDVTHVVNYDCPDDEKMYLHRIGRTGRAGAAGVAITLAVWNELARVEMIKRQLDIDTPSHEVFSTSPMLDELFDLPARGGRTPSVNAHGARRTPVLPPYEGRADAPTSAAATPAGTAETAQIAGSSPAGEDRAATADDEEEGGTRRRGRSRGRSRGGRGGRRPATVAESVDAPPALAPQAPAPQAPAPEASVSAAPAPEVTEAPAGDDAQPRSRRRVRRRAGAGAPATPPEETAQEPTAATPAPAVSAASTTVELAVEAQDPTADGGVSRRTRVRRRVRQDERDITPRQPSPERSAIVGRTSPTDDESEESPKPTRSRDSRARSPKVSSPKTSSPKTSSAKTSSKEDGRGRRGSRSGRNGGANGGPKSRSKRDQHQGESNGPTRQASSPQLDTGELRGEGSPRLDRPLVVVHLP